MSSQLFRTCCRCLACFLIAATSLAAQAAGSPLELDFPDLLRGKNILFVGAHPDDEMESAPMLAEACVLNDATCHFLITSEARSFGCAIAGSGPSDPDECSRVRRDEMRRSAAMLGGEVTFFGWEDLFYAHNAAGLQRTLERWRSDNGGHAALVARFESVIERFDPDIVLTLDPRHGSSCHPNHRAAAKLLLQAIDKRPENGRPEVWMQGSFWVLQKMDGQVKDIYMNSGVIPWPGVDTPVYWYDAARTLANGREAWDYLYEVQRIHRSQFPWLMDGRPAPYVPAEFKRIPFVRSVDIDPEQDLCEPLNLRHFSYDVFGEPGT